MKVLSRRYAEFGVRIAVWFRCSLSKQTVSGNKVLLILTREAVQNLGRPDKAISPTFFKLKIVTRQRALKV
jgi:hypothetical protein